VRSLTPGFRIRAISFRCCARPRRIAASEDADQREVRGEHASGAVNHSISNSLRGLLRGIVRQGQARRGQVRTGQHAIRVYRVADARRIRNGTRDPGEAGAPACWRLELVEIGASSELRAASIQLL
jgi:hypothetical protein